ncbi:M20 metallopeptidase family protein [Phocicoccus pinnipedialis]|uniref:N-acyl-L-amino acid amidohydrolase n=1 Tax=Phocicoccus pinnipedialis TaxID=110845 RepID=A0A6V7R4M8_9BACL|nr:amidohydrolase [Jeotgalicoccus pinnipedialis]MBP1939772.1 amidohydrolase [Jeotgalicoccus pinnipedialis]CAD2072399.1 N-acyl-L-amino acid amidohydrolase [Jeotgalicoccus pinnipedialis]
MYEKYREKIITDRRYLHEHPELSFEEFETAQYIRDILTTLKHCEVVELTKTSTVGIFNKGKGKKLGLRADIDALPIQEAHNIEFKSTIDGKMHACGHDGHTSILLGVARYINDHIEEFDNEVNCIFQHAEEKIPGGAREMVATGFFDDFDFIYGQHLMSTEKTGVIDIKSGPVTANSDKYTIKIQGKGGHASQPEHSIDPIVVGAAFLLSLQTIVSRQVSPFDPVVLSNTVFQAGVTGAENIIPDSATLGGSVRTTTIENRKYVKSKIEKQLKHVCEMYNASYELDYTVGYAAVQNNAEKVEYVKSVVNRIYPNNIVTRKPLMGGEDFSAFSETVPSVYAIIGSGGDTPGQYDYPHHHPKFALDEDSFEYGFNIMVEVMKSYE